MFVMHGRSLATIGQYVWKRISEDNDTLQYLPYIEVLYTCQLVFIGGWSYSGIEQIDFGLTQPLISLKSLILLL